VRARKSCRLLCVQTEVKRARAPEREHVVQHVHCVHEYQMVRTRVWTVVVYLPICQWKKGHGRTTSSITGYTSTYVCPVRRRVLHTPRQPVFAVLSACILSEQILRDDSAAHNADATRLTTQTVSWRGVLAPLHQVRVRVRPFRAKPTVFKGESAGGLLPWLRSYRLLPVLEYRVGYECTRTWYTSSTRVGYLPWYTSSTNVRVCGTRVLVL
jgi:hypothetical protein